VMEKDVKPEYRWWNNSAQLQALAAAAAGQAVRDASGDVTLSVPAHGLAAGMYNVMTSDAGFAPGLKAVTVVDANTLRWHEAALAHPAAAVTSTQPVRLFRALVRGVDWEWGFTEMFMNVNHEVAPGARAVGAAGACADCHDAVAAKVPVCDLYAGAATKPFGCP
jgi:Cytochrome c bacterial